MLPKLHYISQEPHLKNIQEACEAGCQLIQLRVKNISANEFLQMAVAAKEITEKFGAKLIINDLPEIAHAVRAWGVHLGKDDMIPKNARKIVGPECIIGGSTNSFEEIRMMMDSGVDYVGLGPFNNTNTKSNLNPILGLDGITEIMNQVRKHKINIPVIAIGGVKVEDTEDLMKAGVYGIAVSSAISHAADKQHIVSQFMKFLI